MILKKTTDSGKLYKTLCNLISMDLQDRTEGEFEICGHCGKPTNVRKDTPVDARPFYVEGVGIELHPICYREIFGNTHNEQVSAQISLEEMGFFRHDFALDAYPIDGRFEFL